MNLRDVRKPLELNPSELRSLIDRLEEITETKFNDAFADNVNNFMGILREKHQIEVHGVRNKQVAKELTQLRNALGKAATLLGGKMSDDARMALVAASPGHMDTLIDGSQYIERLIEGCGQAIDSLDQRKRPKEYAFAAIKQAMATELARELSSFGVKITAYRDGVFAKCLKAFFYAYKGKVNGVKFDMYATDNLFEIIQKAKDDHADSKRFFLLEI